MLIGEIGLDPDKARGLSWTDVDHTLHGYENRRQKELAGHRLTANLVYNALAEQGLRPEEFLHLPAVDGPRRLPPAPAESMQDFRARLEAQNKERLAARATP